MAARHAGRFSNFFGNLPPEQVDKVLDCILGGIVGIGIISIINHKLENWSQNRTYKKQEHRRRTRQDEDRETETLNMNVNFP